MADAEARPNKIKWYRRPACTAQAKACGYKTPGAARRVAPKFWCAVRTRHFTGLGMGLGGKMVNGRRRLLKVAGRARPTHNSCASFGVLLEIIFESETSVLKMSA